MTINVDCRFDDYPDVGGASSGRVGNGCANIWLIQAPGNGGSDMNGSSYPNGAPVDPATGISHVMPELDPAGTGKTVYKMTIDPAQTLLAGGYLRTEFTFYTGNNDNSNAAAATQPNLNSSDYWFWTSYYLPLDWDPGMPLVLMQLHDSTEAPITLDPNLILTTISDNNYLTTARIDQLTFRQGVSKVDGENPATLANMERRVLDTIPLPLGRWVEFVLRVHAASTDAIGKTDIWIDRRLAFSERRRNSYGGKLYGHQPHIGLYGYWGSGGGRLRRSSIYTKGMVIGDKNQANFNAFMAACGWPNKTELEPAGPFVSA